MSQNVLDRKTRAEYLANPERIPAVIEAVDRKLAGAGNPDKEEFSGIPAHDPETLETNVSGIFLAGVITAGFDANKVFIENGRDHGAAIVRALAARRGRPPTANPR